MAQKPAGRSKTIWIALVVVLVLVIALIAVGADLAGGKSSSTTSSSKSSTTVSSFTCTGSSTSQVVTAANGPVLVGKTGLVSAGVTCPNGSLGTILTYGYGVPINIAVTVQQSKTPVSIGTVLDGNPQNTNPWNVTSTGYTYTLGYGGAGESTLTDTGPHNVYAIVTFSDGTNATSNLVQFTVNAPIA